MRPHTNDQRVLCDNKAKAIIDSVFNAMHVEDSLIWHLIMRKVHTDNKEEYGSMIEINRMGVNGEVLL